MEPKLAYHGPSSTIPRAMKSSTLRTIDGRARKRQSPGLLLVIHCIITMAQVRLSDAGISFGSVKSADACYSALQNAEMSDGSERVNRDGYVDFVNELSDDAFTYFRYDEATNDWGLLPVVSFEELPSSIKEEFYTIACGGAFVACEEAYLYTSGIRNGTNPRDVAYLIGLCMEVKDAIDAELANANIDDIDGDDLDISKMPSLSPSTSTTPTATTTSNVSIVETAVPTNTDDNDGDGLDFSAVPSKSPSTTPTATATSNASFVETAAPITGPTAAASDVLTSGREMIVLTYRAAVSKNVSSNELNEPNNSLRMQLLGAMSTWTNMTATEFNEIDGQETRVGSLFTRRAKVTAAEESSDRGMSLRGRRWKSDGRGLMVHPEFSLESGRISSMDISDVECSDEITVKLQLDSDHCIEVVTNVILNFIGEPPGSIRTDAIIGIRSKFAYDVENGEFHEIFARSTENEFRAVYSATSRFDIDSFLEDDGRDRGEGWGGSSAAAIAAGLCVGLVAVGIGSLTVYRRRRRRRRSSISWWTDDKSHEDSKTVFDSSEATPGSDRVGVNPFLNWQVDYDDRSNQKTSSLDQVFSVESDDDSSMGLFSGFHDSDDSTASSAESSVEKSEGIKGASHGSSTYHDFSLCVKNNITRLVDCCESNGIPDSDIVRVNPLSNRDKRTNNKTTSLNQAFTGGGDDDSSMGIFSGTHDSVETTTFSSASSVEQSEGSEDASRRILSVSGRGAALTTISDVDVGRPSFKPSFTRVTNDEPNFPQDSGVDDSDDGSTSSNKSSTSIEVRLRESSSSSSSTIFPIYTEKLCQMIKKRSWDSTSSSSTTTVAEKWEGDSTLLGRDIEANVDATAVVTALPKSNARSLTEDNIKIRGWDSTSSSSTSIFEWEEDSTPLGRDIEAGVDAAGAVTALPKSNDTVEYNKDDTITSDSSAWNIFRVRESASGTVDSDAVLAAEIAQLMKSGNWDAATVDSDVVHNAEIDRLIQSGNWDGIVAVAARYGEEADRADEQLRQPPRHHGTAHLLGGAL